MIIMHRNMINISMPFNVFCGILSSNTLVIMHNVPMQTYTHAPLFSSTVCCAIAFTLHEGSSLGKYENQSEEDTQTII